MQDDQVQTTDIVAAMGRFAADPQVDVNKIEKLYELQERALCKLAEQKYNAAMVAAQMGIKAIAKSSENPQTSSHYAPLEAIIQGAAPVYTAQGFALSFYEGEAKRPDDIRIMVDIRHAEGHTQVRFIDFPPDVAGIKGNVNKTSIHGKGSTFSYGRRYLMCMIWNIPTGDDTDGNQEDTVSLKQEAELLELIKETSTVEADFLKHYEVARVIELPLTQYPNAKMMLMEKQRYAKLGSKTVTAEDLTSGAGLTSTQMKEAKEVVANIMGEEHTPAQDVTDADREQAEGRGKRKPIEKEAAEAGQETMGEPTQAEYAEFKRIREKNKPTPLPEPAESLEEHVALEETAQEAAGRPAVNPPEPDWLKEMPK